MRHLEQAARAPVVEHEPLPARAELDEPIERRVRIVDRREDAILGELHGAPVAFVRVEIEQRGEDLRVHRHEAERFLVLRDRLAPFVLIELHLGDADEDLRALERRRWAAAATSARLNAESAPSGSFMRAARSPAPMWSFAVPPATTAAEAAPGTGGGGGATAGAALTSRSRARRGARRRRSARRRAAGSTAGGGGRSEIMIFGQVIFLGLLERAL